MGRLRTHNNRHREKQFYGVTGGGRRCEFCRKGKMHVIKEQASVPIGEKGTDSYYVAKGKIPVVRCTRCDCGFVDWRGVDAQERLIEQQTPYRLSPDKMRWIYEPEQVA